MYVVVVRARRSDAAAAATGPAVPPPPSAAAVTAAFARHAAPHGLEHVFVEHTAHGIVTVAWVRANGALSAEAQVREVCRRLAAEELSGYVVDSCEAETGTLLSRLWLPPEG